MTDLPPLARIEFEGDSRQVLASFPLSARRRLGAALFQLQLGEQPGDSKPMKSIGSGVFELRSQDERAWYRVLYLKRIGNRIFVLHSFQKASAKTSRRDLDIAKKRLSDLRARLREQSNVTEI
jgi:phage-related protein